MNIREVNNYSHHRGLKTKRRKRPFLLLLIVFLGGILLAEIVTTNDPAEQISQATEINQTSAQEPIDSTPSPLESLTLPSSGMSAVGTLNRGVIKTSSTNETPVPIASITKTITALVILEKNPMNIGDTGPTITFTQKDEAYYNDYYAKLGTITPVTAGLSMHQYDILQAIMLASSNNLSDTLVDYYFPDREAYLDYANEFLVRNGLTDTTIADASGFSPGSVSTPSDLIKLGQLALQNPVLKEIVAKPNANIAIAGDIPNYNVLIEEPNVIGIKPGLTDEAGYCLLFAAEFTAPDGSTETMIATTIGHQERNIYVQSALQILNDSRTLLTQNN